MFAYSPGITESKPDFSSFGLDEAATQKVFLVSHKGLQLRPPINTFWFLIFQQSASANPQARNTSVEDVTEAVLFLCDQTRAARMTGVILPVDGGFSLQMPKYT